MSKGATEILSMCQDSHESAQSVYTCTYIHCISEYKPAERRRETNSNGTPRNGTHTHTQME